MTHEIKLSIAQAPDYRTIEHTIRTSKPDLRLIHASLRKYLGAPTGVEQKFGLLTWTFEQGWVTVSGACVREMRGFRVKL